MSQISKIKMLMDFLDGAWKKLGVLILLLLAGTMLPVVDAMFMKGAMDSMTSLQLELFMRNSLLLMAVYVGETTITTIGVYIRTTLIETIARRERERMVAKALAMPLIEYDKLSRGDLVSRLTADVNESSRIFTNLYFLFDTVLRAVAAIGYMFVIHWGIALLVVLSGLISIAVNTKVNAPVPKRTQEYQASLGFISSYVLNALEGLYVIKAFLARHRLQESFDKRLGESYGKAKALARQIGVVIIWGVAAGSIPVVIAFVAGGYLTCAGAMTIGGMLAVLRLGDYVGPLTAVGQMTAEVKKSLGAFERIAEILNSKEDEDLVDTAQPPSEPSPDRDESTPSVEARNLTFEYVPDKPILADVSFTVPSGSKVVIVGRSGCGKSTLLKILAGLYRPGPGQVWIDGLDLSRWRLGALMHRITYIPQEPFLFAGTLRENLELGLAGKGDTMGESGPLKREGRIEDRIYDALRRASAIACIEDKTEGLDSPAGERGSNLSGGQRQRICLARALLRDTPILLLDEPTSSLDAASEAEILEGLWEDAEVTAIIVTHRLDIAQRADVVLVLDGGRLVETGSHEELMTAKGLYWALVTGQISINGSSVPGSAGEPAAMKGSAR